MVNIHKRALMDNPSCFCLPQTVRLRTLNIKFKHTFMEIIKTNIPGVLIIEPRVFKANKI